MRSVLLRGLLVLHIVLGVMYLVWRTTQGFQGVLWLSILFLGAELFTFLAVISFSLSHFYAPVIHHSNEFDQLETTFRELPYVDVFVIRRWDSIEATSQTAKAATQMSYPWHRLFVYVVDLDFNSEMQRATPAIPCEYLSCPGPTVDPIEYALTEVTTFGDFVVWLEPGQLPATDLIQQTLPYFFDLAQDGKPNDTGFVQVSLRALGHRRSDHPLQQFIPISRDGSQAAPLLGSGAMIRREALTSVASIDSRRPVLLGSMMHLQGWKSYLCRSSQVDGILLPLRNRRVALLAVLEALKPNPIISSQTTQLQRFQYLWIGIWSLSGLAQLIYFFIPILFLWVGLTPVPAFDPAFFIWFLPYLVVGRLAWLAVFSTSGLWEAWQAERQTGSQFFQSLQALVQASRGMAPYPEKTSQLSLGPQALLILLTLVAIVVGSFRLTQGWEVSWYAFAFGVAWSIYNLLILTVKPPGYDFFTPPTS